MIHGYLVHPTPSYTLHPPRLQNRPSATIMRPTDVQPAADSMEAVAQSKQAFEITAVAAVPQPQHYSVVTGEIGPDVINMSWLLDA